MSREINKEEAVKAFLSSARQIAFACSKIKSDDEDYPTERAIADATARGILALIDGKSCLSIYPLTLVYNTDGEYLKECLDEDIDYVPDGLSLNEDLYLSDGYYQHD